VARDVDPRAVTPASTDPELASRRSEVCELVSKGVQELPDGQREVLLLREVEGLSYEEIAQTMGISKGTVMSRLHYARKKMVVFLRGHGVEPEDVV
jgi:RNA polymerase sigma-70 factor (ECF subfamily)